MSISYNEYVKRPDQEIEYTQEQIEEVIKCKQDFFYFCKYVKIVHPDEGRITFIPRDYQVEFTKMILSNNRVIAKWPRQSGKSQLLSVYIVWYAIFNSDKFVGIASNKQSSATDFLHRVKLTYEELPTFLKPGVVEYNKTSLELDNGTRIQSSATTKDTFRGRTINFLVLDEFAHLNPNVADGFWASNYHALLASMESKVVVISTPKGMFSLFWQLYTDAENNRNTFKHMHVDYTRVPGRNENWKQEQLKNMTAADWKQEQECEFLGSTSTVINPDVLKNLMVGYTGPIAKELDGNLFVYEKPIQGLQYIIGADVAKGTGNDYSAAQVLKVRSLKPIRLEQVAVYNCNTVDIYKYSEILTKIGYYYNSAYLLIENNSEGSGVVSRVWWDLEYMNMFNSGGKTKDLGIRATKTTKPRAVLLMKKLIEDYSLKLVDKNTIDQLADFSEQNGRFACLNLNDDLIAALYWSCHILTTEWLSETFEFEQKEETDDAWGILTDCEPAEDWSWLTERSAIL